MEHRRGYEPIGGVDGGEGARISTLSAALTTKWTRVRLLGVLLVVLFAAGLVALSTVRWGNERNAVRTSAARRPQFLMLAQPERLDDGGSLIVSWVGDPSPFKLSLRDYVTLSCGPMTGDGDYLIRKDVIEEGGSLQRFVIFQGKS